MEVFDQQCVRCLMDGTAGDIMFDNSGCCNYCSEYINLLEKTECRKSLVQDFHHKLKDRKNSQYDCVIGVSGGLDSSWALYTAVENGLKPLAVHMDNGWNSEIAQNNIENLVKKLGVELHTHVINWEDYRDLMQAFFDADVIDVELLYDNAMLAVNWQQAAAIGVKYILAGNNTATEGFRIPSKWSWFKYDKKNIKSIWSSYTKKRFPVSFPSIGTFEYIYYYLKGIRWVNYLDYFDYNKTETEIELEREIGYKPYPYKHYESIFTRFYQGYILPEKYGIDKRKMHLSTLLMNGQLTREKALLLMAQSPYPTREELESDKIYFLKKMKWEASDLEEYLQRPERPHTAYGSESKRWDKFANIYRKYIK